MSAHDYKSLIRHVGHLVEVVTYGKDDHVSSVSVECTDCDEVLLDFDNPDDLDKSESGDIRMFLAIAKIALAREDFIEDISKLNNLSIKEIDRLRRKVNRSLEALNVPEG